MRSATGQNNTGLHEMTDDLPTARSMLPNDSWLCLFVWCRACHHQAPADLRAIIAGGQGDVREGPALWCAQCGSPSPTSS